MAINFPSSPSVNDTYTVNSVVYTWDGVKWNASTGFVAYSLSDKIQEGDTTAEVVDNGAGNSYQTVVVDGSEKLRVKSNGQVSVISSGSAGTPALSIGDDANGLYSPGINQIAIGTNSTGRLFVDASGNVGIGGSPTAKLDVRGTLRVENQATSPSIFLRDTDAAGDAQITQRNSGDLAIINNATTRSTIFETGGSERLRITSDGKLGLGTIAPSAILHATSADNAKTAVLAGATNRIRAYGHLASFSGSAIEATNNAESAYAPLLLNGSSLTLGNNGTAIATVTSVGVGIGTTAPGSLLQVNAATAVDTYIRTTNASATGGFDFGLSGGGDAYLFNRNNKPLIFGTNSGEKVRITSDGKLGLGTNSPTAELTIYDQYDPEINLNQQVWGTVGRILGSADGVSIYAAGSSKQLRFFTDGTRAVTIDSSQRVGIGTTSPSSILHVKGTNAEITTQPNADTESTYLTFRNAAGTSSRGFIGYNYTDDYMNFRTNGSGEKMRIDSSGRLLVGTPIARTNIKYNATSTTPYVQFETAGNNWNNGLSLINNSNAGYAPALRLGLGGGTSIGSNSLVGSVNLGKISFLGADGTQLLEAAAITANVDGTPGANDMPGRLVFSTTKDGQSSPTEAMRINSSQQVLIGQSSGGYTSALLQTPSFLLAPNTVTLSLGEGVYGHYQNNAIADDHVAIDLATGAYTYFTVIVDVAVCNGDTLQSAASIMIDCRETTVNSTVMGGINTTNFQVVNGKTGSDGKFNFCANGQSGSSYLAFRNRLGGTRRVNVMYRIIRVD